jgi:uncharacterized protein (TIGR03000 family)
MYQRCLTVIAGLLATAAFALCPATASAQHHHGGGGGGWHGGGGYRGGYYGGYRGGYYGHGYGRGWGWGGVGIGIGLGYPYGYGYYRGYGYSPYYYGRDYYYDTTPYYYGSPVYDYGTPVYGDTATMPDYAYGDSAQASQDDAARIRVMVPADAKVWFDDRMTQQTGSVREFETPALTPGRDFSYDVKAQWRDRDGKDVTQTKHVDVRANSNATVDFMR